MKLYGVFLAIQIIEVSSASRISAPNDDGSLTLATADIVSDCFGSTESWSELLIVPDGDSDGILEEIYHASETSNSIVVPISEENNEYTYSGESNYLWQRTKPTAVIITTHGLKHLEFVLHSLKNDIRRPWTPGSYFLVVVDNKCDAVQCNGMFKVLWDHWILNAVILCPSSQPATRNQSVIELYTFNPYSADRSPQWETIIHEIVEVSITPGNFNHSWYIFKQSFTAVRSSEDCRDMFFDKTLNLDGYVIPISFDDPEFLLGTIVSHQARMFAADGHTLKTLAKSLRFNVEKVAAVGFEDYGRLLENGSYTGMMNDIYHGRSHLLPTKRRADIYPGLAITYPHKRSGACFTSLIIGDRPQWENLAVAKHIWIGLGISLIFSTVVVYLQNKPRGITYAFFEAERLIIGSSMIRTSNVSKHRFVLGSIFLVVLVTDGAIRGRFISILTIVRPYPNLDTIEQLKEQNVDMYAHRVMKELITDAEVKARVKIYSMFSECLDRLERGGYGEVCFEDCQSLELIALNSSNLHVSSPPFWTAHVTFLTTMNWPLNDRYSFGVRKLVEAGIYDKWQSDMYRELEVDAWKLKRKAEPPYVRPTKLNDVLPAFMILFIGLSAALIVFAWEILGGKNFRCLKC